MSKSHKTVYLAKYVALSSLNNLSKPFSWKQPIIHPIDTYTCIPASKKYMYMLSERQADRHAHTLSKYHNTCACLPHVKNSFFHAKFLL